MTKEEMKLMARNQILEQQLEEQHKKNTHLFITCVALGVANIIIFGLFGLIINNLG